MKLILLLIPLILLSSCTIDWNNEKDNSNTEVLQTINSSEVPIQNLDIETQKTETRNTVKDFWSGFTLSQTDDETILVYNGKTIKSWSHTPPEKVPFIWDEACVDFFESMDMVSPEEREKNSNWKQAVWDALTEKEKKDCIKDSYSTRIHTESIENSRFYRIFQSWYEWYNSWIFDTQTWNIQELPQEADIVKIEFSSQEVSININNERWELKWYKIIYDSTFSDLISKEEIPW